MPYKWFMQELKDDVSPVEAQQRFPMLKHFSCWRLIYFNYEKSTSV
jgi:hypothetical protein